MFPIRSTLVWRAGAQIGRTSKVARLACVCLGIGVSTALAADLTVTPAPGGAGDADLTSSGWSYFDPGFLVDHLPFRLTIGQTISYNDNVANLPTNTQVVDPGALTRLPARGDFYSDTTIAVASRFPMSAQTFFFNGTYAPRQYFTDTALNAQNYSINGGVDYTIADRCTGRLIAGLNQYQSTLSETAGFGVQNVSSTSFNETGRCTISGNIAGLFNSGVSQIEYSGGEAGANFLLNQALNNYDQYYVGGGLEYALTSLDTLRGLATYTHRDFTNRPAGTLGLAPSTDQIDFQFYYSRVFSAKLDGSASGGVSVFEIPGLGTTTQPIYSFQLNYRPTPKFIASGTIARSAGAPQSVVSNFQESDYQSLSLTYTYSPKVNITGVLSHNTTRNPSGNNLATVAPVVFANQENDNASLVVNYQATPLLTATAAYSYVNRTDTSRSGFDAVSNVFRVGLIYTR